MPTPTLTGIEVAHFWAQTESSSNGCLEWTGQRNGLHKTSYGLFTIYREGHRVRLMAHRVALALTATANDGTFACHHCDNPPCVEPAHLYWGDPVTNAADHRERHGHEYLLGARLGCRPDTSRRLAVAVAEAGGLPTAECTILLADYRRDDALLATSQIAAFVERARHGDTVSSDWTGPVASIDYPEPWAVPA